MQQEQKALCSPSLLSDHWAPHSTFTLWTSSPLTSRQWSAFLSPSKPALLGSVGFGSPWGKDVLPPSVVSEWEVLLSISSHLRRICPSVVSACLFASLFYKQGTGCARSWTQRFMSHMRSSASGLFPLSHLSASFAFDMPLHLFSSLILGKSSEIDFFSPSK